MCCIQILKVSYLKIYYLIDDYSSVVSNTKNETRPQKPKSNRTEKVENEYVQYNIRWVSLIII